MEAADTLTKLLSSFEHYYTIEKTDVTPPFSAQAEFRSHNEQYLLVKAAKIASFDSNDFAYFKTLDNLDDSVLTELSLKAWNSGLAKIVPAYGHRNSDVTLIILADKIEERTKKLIKKTKFYKSYKFTLYGYSHFKLVCKELSSGNVYYNRFGSELKKVLTNI